MERNALTRRDFLKFSSLTATGVLLAACAGVAPAAAPDAAPAPAPAAAAEGDT